MQTIAMLHNFCLTENNNYDEMTRGTVLTPGPQVEGLETNGNKPTTTPRVLYLRESLVKRVKEAGLGRVT
jgi:hypothetical protein